MLLNTHTWLLKEYAGARLRPDHLDILIYNVMPDILPIHRGHHARNDPPHRAPPTVPPEHGKARFIQFHLLVDDLSHHGHITRRGHDRFENASGGYAYRKGAALAQNLIELHGGKISAKKRCTGRTCSSRWPWIWWSSGDIPRTWSFFLRPWNGPSKTVSRALSARWSGLTRCRRRLCGTPLCRAWPLTATRSCAGR